MTEHDMLAGDRASASRTPPAQAADGVWGRSPHSVMANIES